MNIKLETQKPAVIETEALVTYAFDQDDRVSGALAELDAATGGRIKALAESGEFSGKMLELTLLHMPPGMAAKRLLIVGAGKADKFATGELRRLAGAALRTLKAKSVKSMAFLAREGQRDSAAAQAVTEGLLLANFDPDHYKTDKKNGPKRMAAATLLGWDAPEGQKGLDRGRIIAESQNFARELINEPSNKLTPSILAQRAEAMASQAGLAVDILDEKRIRELKMGALLSVAQGSIEPPRMIVVTYHPPQPPPAGAPVLAIVGKAVTFDTGGISIKPSEGMEKMKYDMAGGATMLGVIRALAQLQPACRIICVVPSTENMPGGRAQKPGDIQVAMSGKTIEVLNTDAEGRLILADAITYAKRLGATHLVDAATLTGAIVVALANVNVGVFGSDDPFTDKLLACARAAGEKMWRMPLDDDYREFIKGHMADIQNIGSGKGGGAITAAMFIKEFAEDTPWIHLDIAGTAWLDDNKPWMARGASGVALRTLVDLAMNFS